MRTLSVICAVTSMLLVTACSSEPGSGRNNAPETDFVYVNDANDRNLGSVNIGEIIAVKAGNEMLNGMYKGDKAEYRNLDGKLFYTVKQDADGFKIKSGDRTVLKVKWDYPDKIKLADNDEMNNVFEIKLNENDKYKISQNEKLLEEYKLSYTANKVWEGPEMKYSGLESSLAAGIFSVPLCTPIEKMIAIATLKRADK